MLFYSVDAIIDHEGKYWVLEANSNPAMHYYMYDEMLSLLAKAA
jgi:D-alanine-D-alanine ligase-like ATP-grasp enzyme